MRQANGDVDVRHRRPRQVGQELSARLEASQN
jgi:hypothetical protein